MNPMEEKLILVDRDDRPVGCQTKSECHLMSNIRNGLIHRGFSVLIFDSSGRLLVTQRSDNKITFPSHITNTCCSHPSYDIECEREERDGLGVKRAALRRLWEELGITDIGLDDLQWMNRFEYSVVSSERYGEHEIDHVMVLRKDVSVSPNPNEVKACEWVSRDFFPQYLNEQKLKCNPITPWFELMMQSFLFDWWDNLDNLDLYRNTENILRLT